MRANRISFVFGAVVIFLSTSIYRSGAQVTRHTRVALLPNVTTGVENFYNYIYDGGSNNNIGDGGHDMYDNGNQVFYIVDGNRTLSVYDTTAVGNGYTFTSRTSYPFLAFFNITLPERSRNFSIQVISNLGADGRGKMIRNEGSVQRGGMRLRYSSVQAYNASDPTVCEVYFTIHVASNRVFPISSLTISNNQTDAWNNRYDVFGAFQRSIVGYTLLSKFPGQNLKPSEINSVMLRLLAYFQSVNRNGVLYDNFTDILRERLISNLPSVASSVENFYNYTYDGAALRNINDGGRDMYDGGNQIRIQNSGSALYNITYSGDGYSFTSVATHPFTAFFYIYGTKPVDAEMEVNSDLGADGRGTFEHVEGTVSFLPYYMRYNGTQVYGAGDPSVCEIYFLFDLSGVSFSSYSADFDLDVAFNNTFQAKNKARLSTSRKVIFGYTLLSKLGGVQITTEEIESALQKLLESFVGLATTRPETPPPVIDTSLSTNNAVAAATNASLDSLQAALPAISAAITNLYRYVYTGSSINGLGNYVDCIVGRIAYTVTYGVTYGQPDYSFTSLPGTPFISYFTINGDGTSQRSFGIQVDFDSNLAGRPVRRIIDTNFEYNNLRMFVKGYHMYGGAQPSLRESYFMIALDGNPDDLNFQLYASESNPNVPSRIGINGPIGKVVLGYTLISASSGRFIPDDEYNTAMTAILRTFSDTVAPALGAVATTTAPTTTTTFVPPILDNNSLQGTPLLDTTNTLLNDISTSGAVVADAVPDYYSPEYGNTGNSISDNTLYRNNGGARTECIVGLQVYPIRYGETYGGTDFVFTSVAGDPFYAFFNIDDEGSTYREYAIRVRSELAANGAGTFSEFSGSVSYGVYTLEYRGVQVFGTGTGTSLAEMYFFVDLAPENNGQNINFNLLVADRTTRSLLNTIQLNGPIRRGVVGYTLLTRNPGAELDTDTLDQAASNLLQIFAGPELPKDVDLLPSCTVKNLTHSLFDCEAFINEPVKYNGPKTCSSVLSNILQCMAFQVYKCTTGSGQNVLDSYNLSNFNSKWLISQLRDFLADPKDKNSMVETFCYHADLKLAYPSKATEYPDLCKDGTMNRLLEEAMTFMYQFAWAKDRKEICEFYKPIRKNLADLSPNQCRFKLENYISDQASRQYVNEVIRIFFETLPDVELLLCQAEDKGKNLIEDFLSFFVPESK